MYNWLPGYYSPDGKTPMCMQCPLGSSTPERGATSVDQCSGKTLQRNQVFLEIRSNKFVWLNDEYIPYHVVEHKM